MQPGYTLAPKIQYLHWFNKPVVSLRCFVRQGHHSDSNNDNDSHQIPLESDPCKVKMAPTII